MLTLQHLDFGRSQKRPSPNRRQQLALYLQAGARFTWALPSSKSLDVNLCAGMTMYASKRGCFWLRELFTCSFGVGEPQNLAHAIANHFQSYQSSSHLMKLSTGLLCNKTLQNNVAHLSCIVLLYPSLPLFWTTPVSILSTICWPATRWHINYTEYRRVLAFKIPGLKAGCKL